MQDWAKAGMLRWPDVPALFGWLGLDRRGRWLLRGEPITRPQIVETIGLNYEPDAQGRWYFQNGPQRGYVDLAYLPLILRRADTGDGLVAHTGAAVGEVRSAWLDEEGSVLLATDLGPALLDAADLGWALDRLNCGGDALDDASLRLAMQASSGVATSLELRVGSRALAVKRVDSADAPAVLGYVRYPKPD